MQAKNYKMLNTLISKTFHPRHRSLAIRMILTLEDISLRNIHFANLMQDLSPKEGVPLQLKRLSVSELRLLHLFFKEIQKNCPDCYKPNVILILNRIRLLLNQMLVSYTEGRPVSSPTSTIHS
jgi:hypothetical protein